MQIELSHELPEILKFVCLPGVHELPHSRGGKLGGDRAVWLRAVRISPLARIVSRQVHLREDNDFVLARYATHINTLTY